jgi:hypothetical protein
MDIEKLVSGISPPQGEMREYVEAMGARLGCVDLKYSDVGGWGELKDPGDLADKDGRFYCAALGDYVSPEQAETLGRAELEKSAKGKYLLIGYACSAACPRKGGRLSLKEKTAPEAPPIQDEVAERASYFSNILNQRIACDDVQKIANGELVVPNEGFFDWLTFWLFGYSEMDEALREREGKPR